MKKRLLVLLLAFTIGNALACDVCGMDGNNYSPVLFPHLSRHYINLEYAHRRYGSHHGDGAQWNNSSFVLSGQYKAGKKISVTAFLPYQVNRLQADNATDKRSGMGDATLLAAYKIINKTGSKTGHILSVGGGLKFPTGKYKELPEVTEQEQNFQLGTGSTDYIINASNVITKKNWIFSLAGGYKYNTANTSGYRFGDRLNGAVTVAKKFEGKKIILLPYLQFSGEKYYNDAQTHILKSTSGGYVFNAAGGADLRMGKYIFGLSSQSAIVQHLAGGELHARPSIQTHFSISF